MDKKTTINIHKYKNELLKASLIVEIISIKLELIIEEESVSMDNLSNYPQFMDKAMDIEEKHDQLVIIKENLDKVIELINDSIEDINLI